MLGATAMCGLAGYFIMHKAKEAGLDSGLLSKNPFYAAAKMAATVNPDVETVTTDDSNGTITVRDKKTGKTTTLKFDPEKKTMVVIDENGKEATVKVNTDGDKGSVEVAAIGLAEPMKSRSCVMRGFRVASPVSGQLH